MRWNKRGKVEREERVIEVKLDEDSGMVSRQTREMDNVQIVGSFYSFYWKLYLSVLSIYLSSNRSIYLSFLLAIYIFFYLSPGAEAGGYLSVASGLFPCEGDDLVFHHIRQGFFQGLYFPTFPFASCLLTWEGNFFIFSYFFI